MEKNLERVTSLVFILYVLGAFTHRSMEFPLPDFFSENENYLHMSYTQISSVRFKFGTSISLNKDRFFCSASFLRHLLEDSIYIIELSIL